MLPLVVRAKQACVEDNPVILSRYINSASWSERNVAMGDMFACALRNGAVACVNWFLVSGAVDDLSRIQLRSLFTYYMPLLCAKERVRILQIGIVFGFISASHPALRELANTLVEKNDTFKLDMLLAVQVRPTIPYTPPSDRDDKILDVDVECLPASVSPIRLHTHAHDKPARKQDSVHTRALPQRAKRVSKRTVSISLCTVCDQYHGEEQGCSSASKRAKRTR